MITRPVLALIALGALSLAGCSSVEDAASPSPAIESSAVAEETTQTAEASSPHIEPPQEQEAQNAPAAPQPAPPAAPAPASPQPAPAAPAPAPADNSKFGPAIKNQRGNVMKTVGQLAGYDQTASGNFTVEFRVTAIQPNFQCTGPYAEPSINGNYIAVSFEVDTLPALATAPVPAFYLSEYDMAVISPNGVLENDSIGNGLWCLQDSEVLPWGIGPGQKAYGKIILDSAHTSGSLVISLPGGASWEWPF